MKTDTTASLAFERLSALCSIVLIVAGIVLCCKSHPWLGLGSLYVGATMVVLMFMRGATMASRREESDDKSKETV